MNFKKFPSTYKINDFSEDICETQEEIVSPLNKG